MNDGIGNAIAWCALGVPALLAWIGFGMAYLLAPHLAVDPQPLMWAAYAAGGWYCLMVLIFGGWLGLMGLATLG